MKAILRGAVLEFSAHLTTLASSRVVGREHDCAWLAEETSNWCEAHGVDGPMDQDWQAHVGTPDLTTVPMASLLAEVGRRIDTGLAPTVVHNHTGMEPK